MTREELNQLLALLRKFRASYHLSMFYNIKLMDIVDLITSKKANADDGEPNIRKEEL